MGEVLVVLFFVLTIVTLVGHGIWVMVAAIFRALAASSAGEGSDHPVPCPHCKRNNPANLHHCAWCGKLLRGDVTGELSDLAALGRQLRRLQEGGAVDPAVVEDLLARADEYQSRLLQPPPAPRPVETPPQPAAQPPRCRPSYCVR